MPFYYQLEGADGARTAKNLIALRDALEAPVEKGGVPHRSMSDTLLLATWNLRAFSVSDRYVPRDPESRYHIAVHSAVENGLARS